MLLHLRTKKGMRSHHVTHAHKHVRHCTLSSLSQAPFSLGNKMCFTHTICANRIEMWQSRRLSQKYANSIKQRDKRPGIKQVHMSFNFVRTTMRQSFGMNTRKPKTNAENSAKRIQTMEQYENIPFNQSNRLCNRLIKTNTQNAIEADPIHFSHVNIPNISISLHLKMAPGKAWRVFFCLHWFGGQQHYFACNNTKSNWRIGCRMKCFRWVRKWERIVMSNNDGNSGSSTNQKIIKNIKNNHENAGDDSARNHMSLPPMADV